jgi:CRP/FNR family transcriptional regulator, cyclic AMP receptor protein
MPAATQALVDAELLRLSPAVVRRAVARDIRVAQAFLSELSERVLSFVDEIPGNTFTTCGNFAGMAWYVPNAATL